LIFQDLLFLKICTFGSLDELVSVVFISHFQMVKSVGEGFDLLLTLSELTIELVTISLELFFLLGRLNYVVGLRVLTGRLLLSRA